MSKKNLLIVIIVIIIIIIGGYFILHKSKPTTTSGAATLNNSIVETKTSSTYGNYLEDSHGNTLYTYEGDSAGVSNCSGQCLKAWPPFKATGSTANLPANFGVIKRIDNGETQYTYKGIPLYYYANDTKGKVLGNGVGGFYVAKP
jgi:predicted lipoprotein with Yx(FWY)xxD motif